MSLGTQGSNHSFHTQRANRLVQNVVQQGSKITLSHLKYYKSWEKSMLLLMAQANVEAVIRFETAGALVRALGHFHRNDSKKEGEMTLADLAAGRTYEADQQATERFKQDIRSSSSSVKQEEPPQLEAGPGKGDSKIKVEHSQKSPSQTFYSQQSLTKEQHRTLCLLDCPSDMPIKDVERFYARCNVTVICAIQAAVSSDLHHLLENVENSDSAYQIWHALRDSTRSDAISQLNTEARRLYELRMEEGSDPSKFMSTFRHQLKQVNANGGRVEFRLAAALYLGCLSQRTYAFELSKLRDELAKPDATLQWADIRKTLLSRYTDQQSNINADGGYVMAAHLENSRYNQRVHCTFCGRTGHSEQECRTKARLSKEQQQKVKQNEHRRRVEANEDKREVKGDNIHNAHTGNRSKGKIPSDFCMPLLAQAGRPAHTQSRGAIFIDSCAHHHACAEEELFESIGPINPISFTLADHTTKTYLTGGHVRLHNEQGRVLRFFSAYTPDLTGTLLSFGTLIRGGCTSTTGADKVMTIHCPDGHLVLTAQLDNTVFRMRANEAALHKHRLSRQLCGIAAQAGDSIREDLTTWHQRLGHQNDAAVRAHLKQHGIATSTTRTFCDSCAANKITTRVSNTNKVAPAPPKQQHPPSQLPSSAPHSPLKAGRVHTDLCGPFQVTATTGARYFQVLVDEATGYITVQLLGTKTPHLQLERYLRKRTLSGQPVRIMRSDNGGEFVGEFATILEQHGIEHELIVPGVPAQNGFAERANRTILDHARTLSHSCGLPANLWHLSVLAAVHLHNHTPRKGQQLTPYQQFFPDRSGWLPKHFLPLGCLAYVKHTVKQGKMDPRGRPTILIGFETHKSGTYLLRDLHTGRRLKSNHVVANLQEFPWLTPQDTPSSSDPSHLLPAGAADIERTALSIEEEKTQAVQEEESVQEESTAVLEEAADEKHPIEVSQEEDHLSTRSLDVSQKEKEVTPAREESTLPEAQEEKHSIKAYHEEDQFLTGHSLDVSQKAKEATPAQDEEPLLPDKSNKNNSRSLHINHEFFRPLTSEEAQKAKETETQRLHTQEALNRLHQHRKTSHNVNIDKTNILDSSVKRTRNKPKDLHSYANPDYAFITINSTDLNIEVRDTMDATTPKNFKAAMSGPDRTLWAEACDKELRAIEDFGTWQLCDTREVKKAGGNILSARWVFKVKKQADGSVERYKARLVARGFEQVFLKDYDVVYSPVASLDHVRGVFALATTLGLHLRTGDVPNAFLNGDCDKEIFVASPPGVTLPKGKCLRLVKALYGLKQAPRLWNKQIHEALLQYGLTCCKLNPCVYFLTKPTGFIILLLYVDDVLCASNSKDIEDHVMGFLHKTFGIRDQGEPYDKKFLGLVPTVELSDVWLYKGNGLIRILYQHKRGATKVD